MGLWGSPIQEGRAGFLARQLYGGVPRPRAAVAWRHCDGAHASHGCRTDHPAADCRPQVVPPAYYVELRALEIQKEEIDASSFRRRLVDLVGRALRPWPFRWPEPNVTAVPPQPDQPPDQPKGRFLDTWA